MWRCGMGSWEFRVQGRGLGWQCSRFQRGDEDDQTNKAWPPLNPALPIGFCDAVLSSDLSHTCFPGSLAASSPLLLPVMAFPRDSSSVFISLSMSLTPILHHRMVLWYSNYLLICLSQLWAPQWWGRSLYPRTSHSTGVWWVFDEQLRNEWKHSFIHSFVRSLVLQEQGKPSRACLCRKASWWVRK